MSKIRQIRSFQYLLIKNKKWSSIANSISNFDFITCITNLNSNGVYQNCEIIDLTRAKILSVRACSEIDDL